MKILGLSAFSHDASACLLDGDSIVAFAEEERFSRQKHSTEFPIRAIQYCLAQGKLRLSDVDEIAFFWKPLNELVGNLSHFIRYLPESASLLAAHDSAEHSFLSRSVSALRLRSLFRERFPAETIPPVRYYDHHLCHAASAYYCSGFPDTAVLVMDGRGESVCTSIWHGKGGNLENVLSIKVPHSLGHFYAAMTDYLGFRPFRDEWRVMGLAGYGKDTFQKDFTRLYRMEEEGYLLNLEYFKFHVRGQKAWLAQKFIDDFGPPRSPDAGLTPRHFDLAWALQNSVEASGVHLARLAHRLTGSNRLCLAGGVAFNCLMNRQITLQAPFEDFFFQPVAGDAGTSLGAAAVATRRRGSARYFHLKLNDLQLGPSFGDDAIEAALRRANVPFRPTAEVAVETARHLAAGRIVGWFQGRMEVGPRALGNRSLLASPLRADMKEILNSVVKKREAFRPFAPSVLADRASEFFDLPRGVSSPFMILSGLVREEKRATIPAVTHVDGSARVQTVSRATNRKYAELIESFGKITGVPVVLNTSFNENEPIVCTPEDAIECFVRNQFDVLSIGNFIAEKNLR